MAKEKIVGLLFLFVIVCFFAGLYSHFEKRPVKRAAAAVDLPEKSFWKYRCIDTMKSSRDQARNWKDQKDFEERVEKEMKAIAGIGANCVAIGTPYDDEFFPVLEVWVKMARKYSLKIWFRGNFSAWEHWFGYKEELSEAQLFEKTNSFITRHPDIFSDGDIFTPAPEGENGGPFDQVEIDEYTRFRKFLVDQYGVCKHSFSKIGKNIVCNWYSMNGGLAKRMLDQPTVDSLDKLVTIDHYIKTSPEMGEFITYFHNKFGARTAVGEFGAPIPEINGAMDENKQASFVRELFDELYRNKDLVEGVNYWDLYDGSTRLLEDNYNPRPVVEVLKDYFMPGVIYGHVKDAKGDAVKNATVLIDKNGKLKTDSDGRFSVVLPAGDYSLKFELANFVSVSKKLHLAQSDEQNLDIVLKPEKEDWWYQLRQKLGQ